MELFIPRLDGKPSGNACVRDGEETGGGGEDSGSLGEAHVVDQSDGFKSDGEELEKSEVGELDE